jgi:sirohydrochlorin cobaltochelatase
LPLLLDELRQAHPGLSVTLQPAIGEIDSVVAAMAQAALAQLGNEPTAEPVR